MGKITRYEAREMVNEALEDFAAHLGLVYYPYSDRVTGELYEKFLPRPKDESITEDFDVVRTVFGCSKINQRKVPTTKGKVDAIAEHLGVDFAISPEKVTTEKVQVVKKGKK